MEVTDCRRIYDYDCQEEAELTYAIEIFGLDRAKNSLERVVGWWTTGHNINSDTSLIYEDYANLSFNPVHVTVDSSIQGEGVPLKAYVCFS